MELRQPTSVKELVYFTQRTILPNGKAKVWVFKEKCPKCGAALMGKPVDPKTGKVKIRASEYICPKCGYTINKEDYEDTLTANVEYICPKCKNNGAEQVPFKREKVTITNIKTGKKKRVDAIVVSCDNCGENINITKKMK